MKKCLVILSIIFGVGFISTAVLAGRVYYEDLQTYEDYDQQKLNREAMKNIYIQSEVPVNIYPTKGEPYAEFNQRFVDLVGIAPKYKLEVEEKGDSTYIELNQLEDLIFSLGVKEDKATLNVYLPEGQINRLTINNGIYHWNLRQKQVINLENIDVNELQVQGYTTDLNLNGAYGRVDIFNNNGTLNMTSNIPAELYTSGSMKQYLSGQFKKIVIKGNSDEININSDIATNAEIYNEGGNIRLEGNYEKINLKAGYSNIDLKSETECRLTTQGINNTIYASGAFKVINLEEQMSQVEIQSTLIPRGIRMLGEASHTSLSLTLPSNIPGFMLEYIGDEANQEYNEYDNGEEVYGLISTLELDSEFLPITQDDVGGEKYKYKNGEIPIILNKDANLTLEIIDGGYSSVLDKVE